MSDSLRVLKVVHGFPPIEHAGAELCAFWLARELIRRGHEVEVLARTGRQSQEDYTLARETVDGVPVSRLRTPTERAGSLRDMYRDARVLELFHEELKRGYDVVHFHHVYGLSTDLVGAAAEAGARTVVTLHDFWYLCPRGQRFTPRGHLCEEIQPWRCSLCVAKKRVRWAMNAAGRELGGGPGGGLLRRPLSSLGRGARYVAANLALRPIHDRREFILDQLGRADLVLSPSNFVLDEHRRHGLQGRDLRYSPNGVAAGWVPDLAEREPPTGPLRFGFVGSFLQSKGVDLLLEAFAGLSEGEAELHVHGTSPWDGGEFEERLRARYRRSDVHFHGLFVRDELADVISGIDVLVAPSRWYENAPVTLDEAALARIPVIATDHGGTKECVERRRNGLSFRCDDAADLLRTMRRFIEEPDLWGQLREPAEPVRRVEEHADELARWYAEVAGKPE